VESIKKKTIQLPSAIALRYALPHNVNRSRPQEGWMDKGLRKMILLVTAQRNVFFLCTTIARVPTDQTGRFFFVAQAPCRHRRYPLHTDRPRISWNRNIADRRNETTSPRLASRLVVFPLSASCINPSVHVLGWTLFLIK